MDIIISRVSLIVFMLIFLVMGMCSGMAIQKTFNLL